MGVSKPNVDLDISLPAILISFVKIKELETIYRTKREERHGGLSNILCSIIERVQNKNNIYSLIQKFKGLKGQERNKINEILDFIIETLDEELTKSIEKMENEEKEEIKKQLFDSKKHSLIRKLFFGKREYDVECKKCKNMTTNEENFTNTLIDLYSKNEKKIDINNFLEKEEVEITKKITCQNCNKTYEHTMKTKYCDYFQNIKEMPDILIMHFKNREKSKIKGDIDTIMKLKIKKENYNLICFIAKVNDKNLPDEDYNVFYLKNSIWYIYQVNEKEAMEQRIPINAIPLVAFYQRDKTLFQYYYANLISLLDDKENTLELLNQHILNDDICNKYYIVNNKWYDKILKLYEEEENYKNPEYKINHENLTKISKLNYIEMIEKYNIFFERKDVFFEDSYQFQTEAKNKNQ